MVTRKPRILVTAPIHSIFIDIVKPIADIYVYEKPLISDSEIVEAVKKIEPDAIVSVRGVEKIIRKIFEVGKNLKIVARNGVGYDNIDVEAATEYGVWVTITPVKELFQAVAEHAIALIMCLARKICIADRSVRKGEWIDEKLLGLNFEGKTVGIIGLGRIGSEIAKKVKSLGMNIVYFDVVRKEELEKNISIKYLDLHTLLKESDFVVLSVPLTNETKGMISENELKLMKSTAYIINVARGGVIDYKALVKTLKEKQIAGAALDVFPTEPISAEDPLLFLDNVILTPHIAWFTEEARKAMAKTAADEVVRVLQCREPLYPVNPSVKKKAQIKCTDIHTM